MPTGALSSPTVSSEALWRSPSETGAEKSEWTFLETVHEWGLPKFLVNSVGWTRWIENVEEEGVHTATRMLALSSGWISAAYGGDGGRCWGNLWGTSIPKDWGGVEISSSIPALLNWRCLMVPVHRCQLGCRVQFCSWGKKSTEAV